MGLSRPLVTQALTRAHRVRVSPETREEILRVAREMGYQPRNVTTHNIGFVVPSSQIGLDVVSNIFLTATRLLREHGFRLMLFTFDADDVASMRQLLNQKTVDGVILGEWEESAIYHTICASLPTLVLADTPEISTPEDQISMDTVATAARAARYLLERGHRHIALANGPTYSGIIERTGQGILQALSEFGLPPENLHLLNAAAHGDAAEDEDGIEAAIRRVLSCPQPPTAFITLSPGGAISLLNRLQKAGYRVPEDFSVLSIVDSERISNLSPAITATTGVGEEVVETAIRFLLNRIHHPETELQKVFLPGEIIERQSVRSLD